MAHVTLSPPVITALAALITSILTYVADTASSFTSPTYAPLLAFIAGAVAAFVAHAYQTPTPTANAGSTSTVAGPPNP